MLRLEKGCIYYDWVIEQAWRFEILDTYCYKRRSWHFWFPTPKVWPCIPLRARASKRLRRTCLWLSSKVISSKTASQRSAKGKFLPGTLWTWVAYCNNKLMTSTRWWSTFGLTFIGKRANCLIFTEGCLYSSVWLARWWYPTFVVLTTLCGWRQLVSALSQSSVFGCFYWSPIMFNYQKPHSRPIKLTL